MSSGATGSWGPPDPGEATLALSGARGDKVAALDGLATRRTARLRNESGRS